MKKATAVEQKKTSVELSDAEMTAALEKKKQERIVRCGERITAILDEEKCELTAEVLLRSGQVIPQVIIVAK